MRSIFLLALVKVPVVLDPSDAQSRHAGPVNSALPGRKFFQRQIVAVANFIYSQQAAVHRRDDFCLAADYPSSRTGFRQIVNGEWFAKGPDNLRWFYFLVFNHTTLNFALRHFTSFPFRLAFVAGEFFDYLNCQGKRHVYNFTTLAFYRFPAVLDQAENYRS
ncbi:conserved hypothetical protein [Sphingorhabdus sp. 109]|nr:conserved hypothetical protein [Sphingorhabdus sp. 109]